MDFLFLASWASVNGINVVPWTPLKYKWMDWILLLSFPPILFIWWDHFRAFNYQPTLALWFAFGIAFLEKVWRYADYEKYRSLAMVLALCISGLCLSCAIIAAVQNQAWLVFSLMLCECLWYLFVFSIFFEK